MSVMLLIITYNWLLVHSLISNSLAIAYMHDNSVKTLGQEEHLWNCKAQLFYADADMITHFAKFRM